VFKLNAFFNIDGDNKCFLSNKSAYQNLIWRIVWHWSNDAKNSASGYIKL